MDKQNQCPESRLPEFFEAGATCKFKPMGKAQIRKMYFSWLKDDNEQRSFDDVFLEKFRKYVDYWKKQYNIKSVEFKPVVIGKVSLDYNDGVAKLLFESSRHRPLLVTKPIKSHSKLLRWLRDKVRDYCNENTVSIEIEVLKSNLVCPIVTSILLF